MELDQEQGQQPAEEPAGPPQQKQLTINLDEVDDDAPEEKGTKQEAAEPGRKARRTQQIRGIKEQYESRLQALQTEMAELRGRVSVPAPHATPATAGNGADPLDAELTSIEEQKAGLLDAIQALPQNHPRVAALAAMWQKLQDRRDDVRQEKRDAKKRDKEPKGGQDEQRRQVIQTTLEAEFPQVYASKSMSLRAQAEWQELIERNKPDNLATAREACQRAMGKAGLGRPVPGPTDLERTRYSGIPARAGANGGGAGNQWIPSRFEINTARAWTKGMDSALSDEERVRIWAKATGNMPRQTG